jgi:hypothetical protein
MDPRRSPQRVGNAHLADKLAHLLRYSWSATTMSRLPAPIRSETRPMPTDDCIRLDDRQRIPCFGKQSIKTNEYQPIKDTKGLPPRRGSPQDVDLLPKHPDLCLQCCSRSHQVNERPENQPAKVRHYAVASADSSLLANWIKFTIGTGDGRSRPPLAKRRPLIARDACPGGDTSMSGQTAGLRER